MLKKILIAVGVLALVLLFLLVRDYDSPELGQALLDRAGEATGVQMSASGFRFNLFKGMILEEVEATSDAPGRDFDFTLERLVFEHRLMPLLSGTVAIDRIVLERPEVELVESETSPAEKTEAETAEPAEDIEPESTEEAGRGGLALEVNEIRIRDGVVVIRKEGQEGATRIEGLDFTMEDLTLDPTAQSLAALSAEGLLSVDKILFDRLEVNDTDGRFRLDSAVFDLTELTFRTPHGRFGADMQVDFNPVPFTYTLSANGDPLNLNGVVGASEGFGPGTVELDAQGAGAESKDVRADGGVHLAEGQFPATEMFAKIDEALGKDVVVGSKYEATDANFRLEDDRLHLSPFRFEAEFARLDLVGWANLAGPLELTLSVATPREGLTIEGVGADVLDVLADDDGWVAVPMTVTGTLEEPKVRPDARALAAQAGQGLKREAKERATDALRSLIPRD